MMYILTNRTNVALVDKFALNMFSNLMVKFAKSRNRTKSEKDWKWKVIGLPLGVGDVYTSQPMIYLKNTYWGVTFGRFHNRLAVS